MWLASFWRVVESLKTKNMLQTFVNSLVLYLPKSEMGTRHHKAWDLFWELRNDSEGEQNTDAG